jgi:histidine triad (HIT) family protein
MAARWRTPLSVVGICESNGAPIMNDCIFCKIAAGEIPADIVYDDGEVLAFRDINPEAPVHLLLIPRRHIATLNDLSEADAALVGRLYLAGQQIAVKLGVAENGYRTVINCNRDAGQLVFHIHMHLLAGRELGWPPG